MRNSGCYMCDKRYLGCHSECERYRQYKSALDEIKDKKKQEQIWFAYKRSKVYG